MQTPAQLHSVYPISSTLQIMRDLVLRRRADEKIRSQAHAITRGCPPNADACRMTRLLVFVRSAVPFERDPRDVEAITDPALTLEKINTHGAAAGDCDDAATFLSTLLESVGIRTRLIAVSIRADRILHHVAVEAQDRQRGGAWTYLDPYLPNELGGRRRFTQVLRAAI